MEIIKEFWNDIENAFTALDSEQSMMALVLAGIIYLLGLWTAWLIWGIRARRRMKQIRLLESKYNSLEAEHKVLTAKQEQLTLDFEALTKEKETADAQIVSLQRERKAFEHQYSLLKDENSAHMGDIETYIKKIDMMDTQIRNINTHNAQLEEELKATGNTMNSLAAVQSSFNSTKDRLTVVEARIAELIGENQALRSELSGIKPIDTTNTTDTSLGIADIDDDETDTSHIIIGNEEKPVDKIHQIGEARLAVQDAIGRTIPMASMNEKDDLQQINGIGSYIEKQLNELGIYTFEQICAWDDAIIEQVTTAIEFFPGRIKKDDWKGQACALKNGSNNKDIEPVTTTNPKTSVQLNNLKIVEGIGPKIEKILKTADITNLEVLSNADLDTLKAILKKAGGRFRLAVPDTWAKQADMAVKGDLEALKKYQDHLDGGKEPKK